LAGVTITPASLAFHLDPRELEVCARQLPEEQAPAVHAYLDALTERQLRDLAGIRDRLSILSESDLGEWVNPADGGGLDLGRAVRERAIVYLRLDSDQRPLLSQMLAGALLSDLIALSASLQAQPVPTVVLIDEFAAIASAHVARLFARARSAGISLVLCTHELADLASVRRGLREQVLANVSALIAHRQNVPDSAELIAAIAGTKPVWITSELVDGRTGRMARASRRREREYEIQPSLVTQLPTGVAVVITPGSEQRPAIARIHHPASRRSR
jgi:conjugal transfer pilus assembly protein TraD